jgi:methyltransferase
VTAAAVLVVAFLLVEAWRAARNERAQRARGGREPFGDVYAIMTVAYPASFLAMFVEGFSRGAPARAAFAGGLLLFVASKLLKWWAILSLGRAWTFRIIVVPGAQLVDAGPYRFVRHPNYIAVVGELVSVALLTGARVSGPIVTLLFALLIVRRIGVEERALADLTER